MATKKIRYILTKYDDQKFASGDTMRMYPIQRVELDEMDILTIMDLLSWTYEQNCGGKNKLHKALLKDKKLPYYKLRKVLNDEKD